MNLLYILFIQMALQQFDLLFISSMYWGRIHDSTLGWGVPSYAFVKISQKNAWNQDKFSRGGEGGAGSASIVAVRT